MIVRDDNLGARDQLTLLLGYQAELAVDILGIAGEQNAEAILYGDARRHHQERVGEAPIVGIRETIETLPGDDHTHHGSLAAPAPS